MRIGIMLRAFDEKGGIGVYARNITAELLRRDRTNEYVLFYRHGRNIGRFAAYPNVREEVVGAPNKAWWDQVTIPLAARRRQLDVLFHPKFTAPLLAPCPVVMTVHGADWLIPEQAQYYPWLDVRYMRLALPLYVKKCTAVISVAQLTSDDFRRSLRQVNGKLHTVYFAPARHFRPVRDAAALAAIRRRYELPEHFILTVLRHDGGARKNVAGIFKAYAAYHRGAQEPVKLVVGGKDCDRFREEYDLPEDGYGRDILFPGWLEQADLPAIYSLAELYLYPSNLEAFPVPITEAMACGTPIITSNVNGLQEIAGDAALLVDPQDTTAIAAAITRLLDDTGLRLSLAARGLARSRLFDWDKCAAETLSILEAACSG